MPYISRATGETLSTRGGVTLICNSGQFSGNPDGGVVLVSGAGRLNSVLTHAGGLSMSGVPIVFFTGYGTFVSGGPIAASGHRIVATLNAPGGLSGQVNTAGLQVIDMPFTSGLWARAASGAPGFSCSIVPVIGQG